MCIRIDKGGAIFASGSPFPAVEYEGKTFVSGQVNNAYIFPVSGLGNNVRDYPRHDDMLLAASKAVAEQLTEEHFEKGMIYPPFRDIRKISEFSTGKGQNEEEEDAYGGSRSERL